MTNAILVAILIFLVVGLGFAVYYLSQKISGLKNDAAASLLKQDITNLSGDIEKLKDSLNLSVNERLDKSQILMRDSIAKQFSQSAKIISEVTERLAKLDETNRRVVDVADELKTIQNVLQNPKQRGVLGEYFLEEVLSNVLPPDRFELQHRFKDGETVDAVIILDKKKFLPIDSKFSLENYNRLVEEKNKDKREVLIKAFKSDLKNRIDETSKYIRPNEGTMDFAFMFIPSEAIYYDLLINKVGTANTNARDLIEYAFRNKKVIIVSPTSFMAYLQTVLQGLRSLQIEEQAKEIQVRVGMLGDHLKKYDVYMQKLGMSLSTTVNHYNTASKEFKKVDKDVYKIADKNPSVEALLIDGPQRED